MKLTIGPLDVERDMDILGVLAQTQSCGIAFATECKSSVAVIMLCMCLNQHLFNASVSQDSKICIN